MTRFSDLDPERQAAHWRSVQDTLSRADQVLDEAARRESPAELWEAPQPEPAPAPQPVQHRAAAPARDWAAEQRWVESIVRRMIAGETRSTLRMLGAEIGKLVAEERTVTRREIEDRIAKSDTATVELIFGLERKIAELETRAVLKPIRPKLVGGDDAA